MFDGKTQYKAHNLSRPREHVFSETGRGDKKIVDIMRKYSKDYILVVASDDNYVRNSARAYSASILTIADLAKTGRNKKIK